MTRKGKRKGKNEWWHHVLLVLVVAGVGTFFYYLVQLEPSYTPEGERILRHDIYGGSAPRGMADPNGTLPWDMGPTGPEAIAPWP